MTLQTTAGVILAGGRSSRMAGYDKVFAPLAGKPLIEHVIDRVQPQVHALALSVETGSRAIDAFGLRQLTDPSPGHQGPLGGLLSALRHFSDTHEWQFLVPCDAPFLPLDLATSLLNCAAEADAPCAPVVYAQQLQPTFSIWHCSLLERLEHAVGQDGLTGFKQFLRTIRTAESHWPAAEPPPFFNVNDPEALKQADRWINPPAGLVRAC